jgi:hypothetical protein
MEKLCLLWGMIWFLYIIYMNFGLKVLKFNKIVDNILWSVGIEIDLQFTYFIVQFMKN